MIYEKWKKQFRAAVFNLFVHNRDDHAKNFSFLMDDTGAWHVSPSYDLIFSQGPAGEHCTMYMGEGKSPRREHLLQLAKIAQLSEESANKIIDEVREATMRWKSFAQEAEVSTKSSTMIQTTLTRLMG